MVTDNLQKECYTTPTTTNYIVQGSSGTSNLDTSFDNPNGTFYVNGTTSNSFASLATHKLVTKTLDIQANQTVRIGWDRNIGSRQWNGDFAEILLFEESLSANQRNGLNTILATKYALSVPAATNEQIRAGFEALGNLVADGSFEVNTSSTVGTSQGSELGASNYFGSTFGDTDVTPHWGKTGSRNWYVTDNGNSIFPDGDFAFRLDGNATGGVDTLFQDGIFLLAGFKYDLSFDMWGESAGTPKMDVSLTGLDTIQLFDESFTNGNDGSFETKFISFVVDVSGSYRLNFSADDPANGNQHAWIDNVQLFISPVPEPSTAILAILGMLSLGMIFRHRCR